MKTKPILFSTAMVEAILEGRKTQTRRIVKPQPEETRAKGKKVLEVKNYNTANTSQGLAYYWKKDGYREWESSEPFFPKYQTGDILWVRETWRLNGFNFREGIISVEYKDRKTHSFEDLPEGTGDWLDDKVKDLVSLRTLTADSKSNEWKLAPGQNFPWNSSIYMPKWAARIFLKVTDVRVERLQDITEDDAEDEGIEFSSAPIADTGDYSYNPRNYMLTEKEAYGWPYFEEGESKRSFRSLWESIHGKDSWKKNPWVWVCKFEKIEKPENFI